MNYNEALVFLASKILKNGETKRNSLGCLIPKCYANESQSDLVAAHDALNDRLLLDSPITHFKIEWVNARRGLVSLSLYSADGYGAGSNERLVKQECVNIFEGVEA